MPTEQQLDLKLSALHAAGANLELAKTIYAWLTADDSAPLANVTVGAPADKPKAEKATKPKTTEPKAEKPAEPAKEPAKAEPGSKTASEVNAEKEAAKPQLSYDTDVLPEILATLNRLTTAGHSTDDGKAAIVNMMASQFGVKNAKDVKPARWAELVAELKKLGE